MTDGELVRRALEGDPTAREALVERWSAPMLALCHARVGRRHVAEDLAQETLLRGLRALATLHDPDKLGPWLRGIASRVCLDWRKAKQTSQIPFTSLLREGSPDGLAATDAEITQQRVDQQDELQQLMRQVESLPESYREVLMLYYYQDLTYRQLAEVLDVSTATINARLSKARAILRQRMTSPRS